MRLLMRHCKAFFWLLLFITFSVQIVKGQDAVNFLLKGQSKFKVGDYEEALIYFSVAVELNNQLYQAWTGRADARVALEEFDAALEDYSKAIELNPEESIAWFGRSRLKRRAGDYIGAAQDFNKGVAKKMKAWKSSWLQ